MGDRCSGHCCRIFTLGPPDEFAEFAKNEIFKAEASGDEKRANDYRLVLDIVLYRGLMPHPYELVDRLTGKRCRSLAPWHYYTCKHATEQEDGTVQCEIYETRPHMCRSYPNGALCNFTGCTWDEWRVRPGAEYPIPAARLVRRKLLLVSKEDTYIGEERVG